jgi:hypothetical protein
VAEGTNSRENGSFLGLSPTTGVAAAARFLSGAIDSASALGPGNSGVAA